MQYVRSLGGSMSKTWNSINPANLSGAIDVIVIELEDGSLACSPFHVRFGKWSLLRPYEKKVELKVNGQRQNLPMKLGEGGEAFFVFETEQDIPQDLQTSPVVSPSISPSTSLDASTNSLQEPSYLDLGNDQRPKSSSSSLRPSHQSRRISNDLDGLRPLTPIYDGAATIGPTNGRAMPGGRQVREAASVFDLSHTTSVDHQARKATSDYALRTSSHSKSPPPLSREAAYQRATSLSRKLSSSNIRTKVSEKGDIMLDMTGYKSTEDEALRAESIARQLLSEELEGDYDIGALMGADESGNLWIYSSEEAKSLAAKEISRKTNSEMGAVLNDAASDPGYQSDDTTSITSSLEPPQHHRGGSEVAPSRVGGLMTPPQTPPEIGSSPTESGPTYAKTLRLTSRQLQKLELKPGPNPISFTVNKVTCQASMFYWKHDVPIVISDIDGTITKSDALGHMLDMIGRDWTHLGVAKLYSDIVANGYHIMYLTSRSIGLADRTRNYLNGIVQEDWKLPKGPVIMSPDRTIAALRREVWLRKPEVFKMACLRDILNLFGDHQNPFYAGFGNRLTDALSYRSVKIPSNRIFTINADAEVSLDMLTLNKFKTGYVSMREIVDYFFPPITTLVGAEAEDFTDFNYWRTPPPDIDTFTLTDESDAGLTKNASRMSVPQSQFSRTDGGASLDDPEERGSLDEEDDRESSYLSESILSGEDETRNGSLIASVADLSTADRALEGAVEEDIDIVDLAAGNLDGAAIRQPSLQWPQTQGDAVGPTDQIETPEGIGQIPEKTVSTDEPDPTREPMSPSSSSTKSATSTKKTNRTLRAGKRYRRPLLSPATPLDPRLTL